MSFLLWTAVFVLGFTSIGLLMSREWRQSLALLAGQYFAAFWLVLASWPLTMAAAKLVAGWMAAAALGMTLINLQADPAVETSWPQGRFFRSAAAVLVLAVVTAAAPRISFWLPEIGLPVIAGALLLIGMGLLHLGMTAQPLRVILGLLTFLLGFEILYAAVENSILVAGLLAVVHLGLALTGSYLLYLNTLPAAEDAG